MGSYTELYADNYPILSSKSYVVPEVMTIFSETDKLIFERKLSERNVLVWGDLSEEEDETEIAYTYTTTVKEAIDRLEIMGFTLAKAVNDYSLAVAQQATELEEVRSTILEESYQAEFDLFNSSTTDDFIAAFGEIREKRVPHSSNVDIEKFNLSKLEAYLVKNNGWLLKYPCSDIRHYLRVVLESCKADAHVTQDITDVTESGYYLPSDRVRDAEVDSLSFGYEINSKIIVLTEGSTDKTIIERSLSLLYPHLSDYYSFMDFGASNLSGGASSLVDQVKSFVGTGIKNRIVAILDNDTAAHVAKKSLKRTRLPKNISLIHYPDVPLAESYPTLGPAGSQPVNVNGLAGSIEIYLGKEILEEGGQLIPVQWKGFDSTLQKYQGELMGKQAIQKRYFEKLEDCERNPENISNYDWSGIDLILNEIFNTFNS